VIRPGAAVTLGRDTGIVCVGWTGSVKGRDAAFVPGAGRIMKVPVMIAKNAMQLTDIRTNLDNDVNQAEIE